jgi:hypothetical protein
MNRITAFILAATALLLSPPAMAGVIVIPGATGGDFSFKITSLKEARFKETIRQRYDFSCGSAALATLLTYHYRDPVDETEAFKAMYDAGDQKKIRKDGFSLLDIKNFLQKRGYRADGFRAPLEKLAQLGIPAIVLIEQDGYRHFVVVKGVNDREVLLGDPSQGARRLSRERFETLWNGLFFLIRDKREIAATYFNRDEEWRIHANAPLAMALSPSELANITWLLPGSRDF